MKKTFLITGMLGLAGLAIGAVAYVLGREPIEELLAGVSASKPKKRTTTTTKQTASQQKSEKPAKTTTAEKAVSEEVIASVNGEKFHRPNCRYASGDGEKLSRAEAVERGMTPCGVCKP